METSIDAILNRRALVEQPKKGFRVAIDTILVAAAVNARTKEKVLDLGCGVGGAMLALAVRVHGLIVHGLEVQPELAELCRSNIRRNLLEERMDVITGDVAYLPGQLLFAYDHVMLNPPYYESEKHDASPDESKAIANTEPAKQLETWIVGAARCLRTAGTLVMIHRADRLREIMNHMRPYFGDTDVIPVVPKEGERPKRVILRSHKGEGARHVPCRPIILHRSNGGYTDEVEAYLKHNLPIDFVRT